MLYNVVRQQFILSHQTTFSEFVHALEHHWQSSNSCELLIADNLALNPDPAFVQKVTMLIQGWVNNNHTIRIIFFADDDYEAWHYLISCGSPGERYIMLIQPHKENKKGQLLYKRMIESGIKAEIFDHATNLLPPPLPKQMSN